MFVLKGSSAGQQRGRVECRPLKILGVESDGRLIEQGPAYPPFGHSPQNPVVGSSWFITALLREVLVRTITTYRKVGAFYIG